MRIGFRILIVFFTMFFYSCNGQDQKDNGKIIIDPVEIIPFDIKRESVFLSMPDSSVSKDITGFSAVDLFINSAGIIEGFNIKKFFLKSKGDTLINYFENSEIVRGKNSYPISVQSYYSLLSDYVKNIQITKREGIKPQRVNKATILIRFK